MDQRTAKRRLGLLYVAVVGGFAALCVAVSSKPEHYVFAAVVLALLARAAWNLYRRFPGSEAYRPGEKP